MAREAALYLGLISGTSVDAVDAALVAFRGGSVQLVGAHAQRVPDAVRAAVREFCHAPQVDLDRFGALDAELGRLFAETALQLMVQCGVGPDTVRAIGSHGQTIRHRPPGSTGFDDGAAFSLQIADPNVIAERTGITTVADFRRRDVAAGGQGAPLAPLFHRWLLARRRGRFAVLNLGGIANLTLVENGLLIGGFDTGPANTLLDAWCRRHRGRPYDDDGRWAAQGAVHAPLLGRLMAHPYFARRPPKSTGVEEFHLGWVEAVLAELGETVPAGDVMATLAELTAATVAEATTRHWPQTRRLFVCGGGAHNTDLLRRLAARLPETKLASSTELGLDPDWVEAAAFAWLARERLGVRALAACAITGARGPVPLGGVYAGKPGG